MLGAEDTLAMIEAMTSDADAAAAAGEDERYHEGWADALWTLGQHIRGGVKVTCFPPGSCQCHPFRLEP